jgi:REP element-mobilizing transposase RayT
VHQPLHDVFNRSSIVFLTLCSQDRRPLFDKPDIHDLLKHSWAEADAWRVGRYVLMPDHIHLFCAPGRHEYPPLKTWVQFWKSVASRRWPRKSEQPVWQKSFWDTQLRRVESYAEKWEYVRRNPVRAGLCPSPEEWPFQGEMNVLIWHD